jgi:hypothetical protein
MKKLWVFLPLCVFLGAGLCSKKGEEERIIVIIQDETSPKSDSTALDSASSDTTRIQDTTHVVDTIVDTMVLVDTVAAAPDTLMQSKAGVRTMSLTGAVALLEHDLSRGDAKRMLRHIDALGDAVSAELEKLESTGEDKPGGQRKRALNMFLMKLWGVKRAVKDFEKEGIPEEDKENIQSLIDELDALARRIEGKTT